MIVIAHRGLLEGPNQELENRPDQIERALAMGFEVEVDVWFTNEPHPVKGAPHVVPTWWTGHDKPQYRVSQAFLERPSLWLHVKSYLAIPEMTPQMHWFYHDQDDYTLTSKGYVWCHPRSMPFHNKPSVMVLPESHDLENGVTDPLEIGDNLRLLWDSDICYVCTDYGLSVQKAAKIALDNNQPPYGPPRE